jgi:peroxiredoxin
LLSAALATLALTAAHHVYGGLIYRTPWRLHGAAVVVPIGLLLLAAFALYRRSPDSAAGRWAGRALVFIAAVFPIAGIGAFEGAYNHLLKNALYLGGISAEAFARLFPPPTYERPNDALFELSGIAQVVPAAIAAVAGFRFFRGVRRGSNAGAGLIAPGTMLPSYELADVRGEPVAIPDSQRVVHLQFRRFAGCPICNLHLASIAARHDQIQAAGVREVVLFHSEAHELRKHVEDFPLAVVADPNRRLYAAFGVESAPRALLDPRAWPGVLAAVVLGTVAIIRGRARPPSLQPRGGRLGLPADFLIDKSGRVVDCHYGEHADDQWSADEIIARAKACRAAGDDEPRRQ